MIRVFALALLLAGCATPREPVVRTIEVRVPVPVVCVDRVPERPAGLGEMPGDVVTALSRALARLLEWQAYGVEADGKLRACADQQPSHSSWSAASSISRARATGSLGARSIHSTSQIRESPEA